MRSARAAFVAVMALAGAGWAGTNNLDYYRKSNPSDDLTRHRPVELLHALKLNAHVWRQYTVVLRVENWVREEDLPELVTQLDSKEPCTPVVDAHSSFNPPISTVGAQAAFMIEGFRKGVYPPTLSAREPTAEQKAEIRDWWKRRAPGGLLLK